MASETGGILDWFAKNPRIGLLGTAASVVSVILAFVLYDVRKRELTFLVNPTTTTIVRSGQSSDIHVLFREQPVVTDVTAFQVALWNAGKESIKPDNIVEQIVLRTSPSVPILEARIKHIGREASGFSVDRTAAAKGELRFSWKILERNDGAVMQIISAGPSSTALSLSGAIEGQEAIAVTSSFKTKWWRRMAYLIPVLGNFMTAFFMFRRIDLGDTGASFKIAVVVSILVTIAASGWMIYVFETRLTDLITQSLRFD